ncbi:hypothetical protein BGZ98_003536, partial [Dissophora globulifera]
NGSGSGSDSAPPGWTSTLKSWRSVLPGFGSQPETDEDNTVPDPDPASHQITDYREGERRDIHGNTVQFGSASSPDEVLREPLTHGTQPPDNLQLPTPNDPSRTQLPTTTTVKTVAPPIRTGSKTEEAARKVVKTVMKPKRNVILPDYYEQFPDVQPSLLLTVPVGSTEVAIVSRVASPAISPVVDGSFTGRVSSFMRRTLDSVKSLLYLPASPSPKGRTNDTPLPQGPRGIRKVVIIGVHGWYPRKAIRTVIGEPTGTSSKFCDEMDLALKEYLESHGKHLESDDITLIPLEGEGKVLERVETLHDTLVRNQTWRRAVHEADLVLVATHSQGTPTSILLVARWIQEGLLRVREGDPQIQRIGILAMAGITHGPFPYLKGNLVVRWFEADAAKELFEFMDSESSIARKYQDIVLASGVRLTCVASLEDQVVPLYSSVMTSIHHPSIVRAVYIDAASYQNDFLINLIAFSLRLRNAGVDDHGILVHLSEVIAGSLYSEGHSTIYEEREVYMLSIRSLLEPPAKLTAEMARSEPILNPFRAKQRLNPFFLPWAMRGIADEIMSRGDQILIKELERLKRLYNEWNPVTKGMKEIKFRLEPLRSRL